MLNAARLQQRMSELRLSQSELARRVGVTQTTIRKLVSGGGYGSKYLHLIARALGTTVEYLTGEIDDPEADAPPPPELSYDDAQLLEAVRSLSAKNRAALTLVARVMAGNDAPAAVAPELLLPPERALARMFEGLLRVMDRTLPLTEQGQLLAERLPIGLSQLKDLLPAEGTPAETTPPSPSPTPVRARP